MSGQLEKTLHQGQRPEQDKTPRSTQQAPDTAWHPPGNPHPSRSKRILPHSQLPFCCLHPVLDGAPPTDTGTPRVWGAWNRLSGCPHSDNAPMSRLWVLPVETGLSPSPSRSHSCFELGCSSTSWAKVWEGWVRTDHQAVSAQCQGHTTQATPHPLPVGPSLRQQGEIPQALPMLPEPRNRQSWGRKPSFFSPALCRGAHAHPTRSLGPGWGPVPLVGEGACLVSLHPPQSSSAEQGMKREMA